MLPSSVIGRTAETRKYSNGRPPLRPLPPTMTFIPTAILPPPLRALLFFIKPSAPLSLHRPSQGLPHCVLLGWLDFSYFFLRIPRSGGMLVLRVTRQVYVVKKNIYKRTFSRFHSGKNLQKAPKIVV